MARPINLRGGRKPRAVKEQEERAAILSELDQIAIRAAPDAMRLLASAVSGATKPGREELAAAQTLLDRVMGKAANQPPVDPESEKTHAFLAELTRVIQTEARPEQTGDAPLVDGDSLPVRAD